MIHIQQAPIRCPVDDLVQRKSLLCLFALYHTPKGHKFCLKQVALCQGNCRGTSTVRNACIVSHSPKYKNFQSGNWDQAFCQIVCYNTTWHELNEMYALKAIRSFPISVWVYSIMDHSLSTVLLPTKCFFWGFTSFVGSFSDIIFGWNWSGGRRLIHCPHPHRHTSLLPGHHLETRLWYCPDFGQAHLRTDMMPNSEQSLESHLTSQYNDNTSTALIFQNALHWRLSLTCYLSQ